MKFRILICIICFTGLAVSPGNAQIKRNFFKTLEFYAGGGPTLYFGEMGGKDSDVTGIQTIFDNLDIDLWQMRASATAGLRYSLYKNFAASIELTPMIISGNDLRSNKEGSRGDTLSSVRSWSHTTFVTELSARAEIYMSDRLNSYAPYAILGIGGMAFSGTGKRETTVSHSGFCTSYILGFGQRFPAKKGKAHSVELAYHFTGGKNADNLDGYPKGGNNDLLFTVTYKYSLQLSTKPGR